MKIKIGENEYSIKYGYKPTLMERTISKTVKMASTLENKGDDMGAQLEALENLLLYLPEMLLVGLQVHYKEFRYDYETKQGKEEQLNKAFDLVEKYFEQDDADGIGLFYNLQSALTEDSFLSRLFDKEKKAQEMENIVTTDKAEETTEVIPMPIATEN